MIDWGIADFYFPDKTYSPYCGTKNYKSPEQLCRDTAYHYSTDIWSVGCIFATMMFKIKTFFRGVDDDDQIYKIMRVLGSKRLIEYALKYTLKVPVDIINVLKTEQFNGVPW